MKKKMERFDEKLAEMAKTELENEVCIDENSKSGLYQVKGCLQACEMCEVIMSHQHVS